MFVKKVPETVPSRRADTMILMGLDRLIDALTFDPRKTGQLSILVHLLPLDLGNCPLDADHPFADPPAALHAVHARPRAIGIRTAQLTARQHADQTSGAAARLDRVLGPAQALAPEVQQLRQCL